MAVPRAAEWCVSPPLASSLYARAAALHHTAPYPTRWPASSRQGDCEQWPPPSPSLLQLHNLRVKGENVLSALLRGYGRENSAQPGFSVPPRRSTSADIPLQRVP